MEQICAENLYQMKHPEDKFENFAVFVPGEVFRRPRHFCPRLSQSPEDALAAEIFSIKYI